MWAESVVDRLLVQWRAEIDSVPMPELVSIERAVAIIECARRARSA
ncbi:hypothetical protein [Amycolatopsis albispora]|nr:hypothetical protein [Amycolatopsis albispora]